MNRLQYFHAMKHNKTNSNFAGMVVKEFTACVEVPTLEQIHNLILDYCKGNQKSVGIPIGLVMVNPKDQYNKKIGRHESLKRTRTLPFKLDNILFENDRTTLHLQCSDKKSGIYSITLELGLNRSKPFLIQVLRG